jgi:hypothetical protein
MKKLICMIGLVALTSCSHMGCCHKKCDQCDMHKKEQCAKGEKDHAQCPMEKAAPTTEKK